MFVVNIFLLNSANMALLLSTISESYTKMENLKTAGLETRPRNKKTSFKESFFVICTKKVLKLQKLKHKKIIFIHKCM